MNNNICPKCGNQYSERPALSREDNKSDICPDCGMIEAFNATSQGLSPYESRESKPTKKNHYS